MDTREWPDKGLLGSAGYKVGRSGDVTSVRRKILDGVFCKKLSKVNSASYMREWGEPESSQRLKKMANTILSLASKAKNKASELFFSNIRMGG